MTKPKNTEGVKPEEKILEDKTSEAKKIESLGFTEDIQRQIFSSILACSKLGWQDPKYISLCMSILKPESFENLILQNFFKIIKKFYDKQDEILTPPEFREEVKLFLCLDKNRNLPEDEYLDVLKDILKLEREAISFDYGRDKIIKFAQHQAFKNALIIAAKKYVPLLEVNSHIEELQRIQEMGIEYEDENVGFKLTPLSEVKAEEITWLWHGIIPKGKLSILCGDPDVGKSFLTHFLACNLSTGKPLPHTQNHPISKASTLIITAEDSPSDTIKPRVENMNGDSSKIIIIEGTKEKDSLKQFDFTEDLKRLEILLEKRRDVKLLIIDPITAYMKKIDMKMDAEVRTNIIKPLSKLAEKYGISIILVAHLNKNPALKAVYRISGTVGFLAGARTVWLVMNDDEDKTGEKRKLCCLKMNIAKKPKQAMIFKIFEPKEGKPILTFMDKLCFINVESELAGKEKPIYESQDFLKVVLKDGKRLQEDILERAKLTGIAERTLYRAKSKLRIISEKGTGKGAPWFWILPKKEAEND